ncbi:hypothetical protein GCM10011491_30320 [Brucella endophytica]|uniref:Uncharacterized protein n=1 Tax=Brucella endophytica TaxID=1963359 RepID=A0A916WI37_9HYPH|nr:hypothetical protein [Brucella endophytica]GGB00012.1 hypothetical protein GCM10011491_30320 [Brucella endophytica]
MTISEQAMKAALEQAYKLGFSASAEGYNAEHPFDGVDFTKDRQWAERREKDLSCLRLYATPPVMPAERA